MSWQRSCSLKEAVGYKVLYPLAASLDPWPLWGRGGFPSKKAFLLTQLWSHGVKGRGSLHVQRYGLRSHRACRELGRSGLTPEKWVTASEAGSGPGGWSVLLAAEDRGSATLLAFCLHSVDWAVKSRLLQKRIGHSQESMHRAMEKQIRYCNTREHKANLEVTCKRTQHRVSALLGALWSTKKDWEVCRHFFFFPIFKIKSIFVWYFECSKHADSSFPWFCWRACGRRTQQNTSSFLSVFIWEKQCLDFEQSLFSHLMLLRMSVLKRC